MALRVRMAQCLLDEPVQSALDCAVLSISGSPVLAQKEWNGCVARDWSHISLCLSVCGSAGQCRSVSVGQCQSESVSVCQCLSVSVCVCLSLSVCWSASVCLGLSRSVSVWFVGCELVHQTLT